MTAKRISLFLTALTALVLTLLTVLALALLPPRLSALGDGALLGGVHSEELGEDSNFPARPPDLPGRIELLATQQTAPERLTIAEQVLESPEDKGTRFLEHLGDALDYELAEDGEEHRRYAAVFRLGDSQAVYHVVAFSRLLEFRPELEAADVYGGLQAAGK